MRLRLVSAPRARGASRDPDHSTSHSQEGINHGLLLRWTKGFGAPNVEGHDVAAMFAKSLEKFVRLPSPARARLRATSNPNPFPRPAGDSGPHDRSHQRHYGYLDRLGLRRPDYSSRSVKPRRPWPRPVSEAADLVRESPGIIFGTGCNAAYMEKISAITKLEGLDVPADAEVCLFPFGLLAQLGPELSLS